MSSLEKTWGQERFTASFYDAAVHNPLIRRLGALALWGLDIERLLNLLERLQEAPANTKVLDVPCGGGLAFGALRKHHGLDYTAFDFSPVMLDRARQKQQQLELDGIQYQQGDVGNLPYADGAFDLCLSFNGMHCFPDPALAIREMARVLKPGGKLRCSLVIKGAGRRYDAMIRLFQWRNWFGPCCTRTELQRWLQAADLDLVLSEQSGALYMFEAVRRAA